MTALLDGITLDPAVCHGEPCLKGTRVMVWHAVPFLANGDSVDDILAAYPGIARGGCPGLSRVRGRADPSEAAPREAQLLMGASEVDENLSPDLAKPLVAAGHDAATVSGWSPRGTLWLVEPGRIRIHEGGL
jgi:hypothetical protein